MAIISRLSALEILDSRGRPTIKATCEFTSGARGSASVPSGASTGLFEAHELRDGDPHRYAGLGCQTAAQNISGQLNQQLTGKTFNTQRQFDTTIINIDGTADKSRLGANTLLASSLAFARANAADSGEPLYQHFANLLRMGRHINTLPRPTVNLFSGGKHAGGQVEIQDVLIVAISADSVDRALSMTYEVYQAAVRLTGEKYHARPLVADEGGLAPGVPNVETMISDATKAIETAGFDPGTDMSLCLDLAASHFFNGDAYVIGGDRLSSAQMIELIDGWVTRFPIVSIEDGLAENDWANWPALRRRLAGRAITLGDDFLTTNPERISQAIRENAADALLLKVNQIGTVSEAADACRLARSAGWTVVVSARSGETEDDWLADLAVGWRSDALKVGSITRSERLAKWNRLLEIERETRLPLHPWPTVV